MNDPYLFHQTPTALARLLVATLPLAEGDVLVEPFRGEGAFWDAFPEGFTKDWAEITQGRDYTSLKDYDWVITNPPFRMEGKNTVFPLLEYYSDRARKGIAFLVNDKGFCTLTPTRLASLQSKGWGLTALHVCAVPKWRGRYYWLVWEKNKPSFLHPISYK